jgi:hypothetical protein
MCVLLSIEVVDQAVPPVSGSITGIVAENKCNPRDSNTSYEDVSVDWGALKTKSTGLSNSTPFCAGIV